MCGDLTARLDAAGDGGARMRAADSDRDRAAAALKAAYADGRLTLGEFEERVGRALSARTFGDLSVALDGLPRPAAGRPGAVRYADPAALPGSGRARGGGLLPVLIAVCLAAALLHPHWLACLAGHLAGTRTWIITVCVLVSSSRRPGGRVPLGPGTGRSRDRWRGQRRRHAARQACACWEVQP
jgi:hypothetical protein